MQRKKNMAVHFVANLSIKIKNQVTITSESYGYSRHNTNIKVSAYRLRFEEFLSSSSY